MSLQRFHDAQAESPDGYEDALAQMRRGRKNSHWIWYIFPQIEGLGHSSMAQDFALRDLEEACAYLRDPLLRARYEEIAGVVGGHLECGAKVGHLMGSSIDALKLASSITLFRAAAARLAETDPGYSALAAGCGAILERLAEQGYPACEHTLARLGGGAK